MAPGRTTRNTRAATNKEQPRIDNLFPATRRGVTTLPGKDLDGGKSSTSNGAKRVLFDDDPPQSVVLTTHDVVDTTVLQNQANPRPRARRPLFTEELKTEDVVPATKEEKVKEEPPVVRNDAVEPRSMIPTANEVASSIGSPRKKIGSVAELQARLAQNGKARVLHQQTAARKLELVAEREAALKSPQKQVITRITEGSPPKRAKKDRDTSKGRKGPLKVIPPDYILPQPPKSMEKNVEVEAVEEEVAPSMPSIYGSHLLKEEIRDLIHKLEKVSENGERKWRLPRAYMELEKLFSATDQILSIRYGRQTCILSTITTEVQKLLRTSVKACDFAKLLTIYPGAYKVELKALTMVGDRPGGARSSRYEHVITPNFDEDLGDFLNAPLPTPSKCDPLPPVTPSKVITPMKKGIITSSSGIKIPPSPRKPGTPSKAMQPREAQPDFRKRLEGWRQSLRLKIFRYLLAQRVVDAHAKFLADIDKAARRPPPSPTLPDRLHKTFRENIDTMCPPVSETILPQPDEKETVKQHEGMADFVKRTYSQNEMESTDRDGQKTPEKKDTVLREEQPKKMSLQERIRAKEMERRRMEMKANPELEQKISDIKSLLERNLRLLLNVYETRSRLSLDIKVVEERLIGDGRLSKDRVHALLHRLCSLLPTHFTMPQVSQGVFFKLSDNSVSTREEIEVLLKKELLKSERESSPSFTRAP